MIQPDVKTDVRHDAGGKSDPDDQVNRSVDVWLRGIMKLSDSLYYDVTKMRIWRTSASTGR